MLRLFCKLVIDMRDIKSLTGVGEKRAKDFEKKGIRTVEELLYFFPRGYEDRNEVKNIEDCAVGDTVCIKGTVMAPVREVRIRKNMTIYSMIVCDESGAMSVMWYNNRFVKNQFKTDDVYMFFGKVSGKGGKKEMQNPVFEKPDKNKYTGRIVPIYPLSGALTQKIVQTAMESAVKCMGELREYLPHDIRERFNISEINFSMRNIHFPENFDNYRIARRRFVFEELFILQLALLLRRGNNKKSIREPFFDVSCVKEFEDSLPFELTGAQRRVISEICTDFLKNTAMNRLIQGDVGSGKTAVAAAAMYVSSKNGYQSAIMAPTEILANQHFETFGNFFEGTGIRVCLLTGNTKKKKELYEKIAAGEFDVIVGTHALIQKDVEYKNLGLVIADEQHRFGVKQRASLADKGENPHVIIMSATPIPRTLAFILYGDLDISVIDELPPGRKPVATYAVGDNMRKRAYAFMQKNVAAGMQCYVVCPLIEETESVDLKNASDLKDNLQKAFPDITFGLIHGKMKAKEKDEVMRRFVDGEIRVLVSTTVIEVGVNVPSGNMMIIENAERFGLSQLHQLRGRVGRGADQAYCIMICRAVNEVTKKRMETMCMSNDGFYISEQDLKLRGPGDFFGTRQHGLPDLKIANLFEDMDILKCAQEAVRIILEEDPSLEHNPGLKKRIDTMFSENIIMN